MQLIGLTGVAGSGKSTVASYLVEHHGFTRLSFAAPLKKMLRTLNPLVGTVNGQGVPVTLSALSEHLDGDENAIKESHYGTEYRRLLQVLGTDCIRAVDPDFWVNAAMKQMTDEAGKYVFDDVRFPNEADVITELSPWGLWNVWRPGYEAINGHESEKWAGEMGECAAIGNVTSLEYLHASVGYQLETAYPQEVSA